MEQSRTSPSRWYLAERAGLLKTFTTGFAKSTVAIDMSQRFSHTERDLSASQQWGLTGIALHPNFATNGFIFLAYNARPAAGAPVHSYVIRLTANAARTSFNPASEKVLFDLVQTKNTHHIGQVIFGPDGYLYIGSGDGSSRLDGEAYRSQDPRSLYGKVLRVDVDSTFLPGKNYAIPTTNPFVDGTAGAPEVWLLGLRNPWRFTFERTSGDLWLGDVGYNEWEEVDRIPRNGGGGNYGWPIYEGPKCHLTVPGECDPRRFKAPVYQFPHASGPLAVIGGYVYRGRKIPKLAGSYVFGSTLVKTLWALQPANGYRRTDLTSLPTSGPDSFAEDVDGELYVLASRPNASVVYKIVPNTSPGGGTGPAPKLSGTGCFASMKPLVFASGVIPYGVNSALWADGADKSRGMALPDHATIGVDPVSGDFALPKGSVLIKTFLYSGVPHETRLLMRHSNGTWRGYTYEWNADGRDATLLPSPSKTKTIPGVGHSPISWTYPSRQQCMVCHNDSVGVTLGLETLQINGDFKYASTGRISNQLSTWDHIGLFAQPIPAANASPALIERSPLSTSRTRRVRSYLHSNCSYCHNPGTGLANVNFRYTASMASMKACNAEPIGSTLGVADAVLLAPGDETRSIIALRMMRRDSTKVPSFQMPPLGTRLVDSFTPLRIIPWIKDASVCDPEADVDSDADGVPDIADNCIDKPNPDQADDNRDGFGNRCDADFNNDGLTDVQKDKPRLVSKLGARRNEAAYLITLDLNHDQIINDLDLRIFEELKGFPPGPSALRP